MKILYVITKGNFGGAQRYVFDLARAFKDKHQVTVALGAGEILEQKLAASNIPVIKIPRLGRDIRLPDEFRVFGALISLFRRERPDVVHVNSSKIGGLGSLAARIAGVKKIIFTVHGFAFNENRPFLQKLVIRFLSWLTVMFSTRTICITETEFDTLRRWPFSAHKAVLIHNGIDHIDFKDRAAAREELCRILKIDAATLAGKTIVGTISELTKNKGLRYAIDAFKDLPETVFFILGSGEERQTLEKQIAELGLSRRVFCAGFVAEAATLLAAFDIFLLASIKEGLPYVLLESAAAAVPVIATSVGGIPALIQDGKTGILARPGDSTALAAAILRLQTDPGLGRVFSENLAAAVRRGYSLAAMAKATAHVYTGQAAS